MVRNDEADREGVKASIAKASILKASILKASHGRFRNRFFFGASCRLRRKLRRPAAAKDGEPV
jgi:hypothetical protein